MNSTISWNLRNHRSINWDQFKHTVDTDFQVTSSLRECLCAHAQKATSVLVAILKKDGNFFQSRIICPKMLTWRLILKTGKVKYEL